ncbi:MAG TPA: DUF488 family protein [Armatimonadota bacterium]|jgi:uncharacterized protein YeaO (DUF488 family)
MVKLKRIYESPAPDDGVRILIDRLWPRGVSRETAALDDWDREIAPSPDLRKAFSHDPEHWVAFRAGYFAELQANRDAVERLLRFAREGTLTLLYAAKDPVYNHAQVLKEYLDGQMDAGAAS